MKGYEDKKRSYQDVIFSIQLLMIWMIIARANFKIDSCKNSPAFRWNR